MNRIDIVMDIDFAAIENEIHSPRDSVFKWWWDACNENAALILPSFLVPLEVSPHNHFVDIWLDFLVLCQNLIALWVFEKLHCAVAAGVTLSTMPTMSQAERDEFFARLDSFDAESETEDDLDSPQKCTRPERPTANKVSTAPQMLRNAEASSTPQPGRDSHVEAKVPEFDNEPAESGPRRSSRSTKGKTSSRDDGRKPQITRTDGSGIFAGLSFCAC